MEIEEWIGEWLLEIIWWNDLIDSEGFMGVDKWEEIENGKEVKIMGREWEVKLWIVIDWKRNERRVFELDKDEERDGEDKEKFLGWEEGIEKNGLEYWGEGEKMKIKIGRRGKFRKMSEIGERINGKIEIVDEKLRL